MIAIVNFVAIHGFAPLYFQELIFYYKPLHDLLYAGPALNHLNVLSFVVCILKGAFHDFLSSGPKE